MPGGRLAGRLAFDAVALALLVIALAYYWLDNATHEVVGTALFALVIFHNVLNRRWYGRAATALHVPRQAANAAATLGLVAAMLVLLATSVLVSQFVFAAVAPENGFAARRLHAFAGYWALVMVSVHLGLRWPTVMAFARQATGLDGRSGPRTAVLRATAVALAVSGLWAADQIDLWPKLTMQITMAFWDFTEDASGFFRRVLQVVALFAVATHYCVAGMQRLARARPGRMRAVR